MYQADTLHNSSRRRAGSTSVFYIIVVGAYIGLTNNTQRYALVIDTSLIAVKKKLNNTFDRLYANNCDSTITLQFINSLSNPLNVEGVTHNQPII